MPIPLVVVSLSSLWGQSAEPESFFQDTAILEALEAHRGTSLGIDPSTPLGEFLRTFVLAPPGATSVSVTPELLERAYATFEYFTRPRFFVGQQVLATDAVTGWITHRATIQEILPGDQYRLEVTEVLEYADDMSPKRTQTVERVVDHAEMTRLNGPTTPAQGPVRYSGVLLDPATDPVLAEFMAQAQAIVEERFPDFRLPPDPLEAEQKRLYLELMKLLAVMEHPARASPELAVRMGEMRADPFYGSSGNSSRAGAHLKYRFGVCYEQAAIVWYVLDRTARRAGFAWQLVDGATLDGSGHGFMTARARTHPKLYITDPSWESDGQWWRPGNAYDGNLFMEVDEAFRDKTWDRNRRIVSLEGESVPVPPPSVRDGIRARLRGIEPRFARAARSAIAGPAMGAPVLAGAFLAKELVLAMAEGDPSRLSDAGEAVGSGEFWEAYGAFALAGVVGQGAAESALAELPGGLRWIRWLGAYAVPIYVGSAFVQAQFLDGDMGAAFVDATSFLAAAGAVMPGGMALRSMVYPTLAKAGPPGWVAIAGIELVQLTATFLLADAVQPYVEGTVDLAEETWAAGTETLGEWFPSAGAAVGEWAGSAWEQASGWASEAAAPADGESWDGGVMLWP